MAEIPDSVKKCVAILSAAKSDTEKFAGLFMVTKIVKSSECTAISKKLILEAIGFKFLKRLLLSSDVPTDCPPMVYKSVALSVISSFCSEPAIAVHPEILSNIPVFLEIVSKADDDDLEDNLMVITETYNCLLNISYTEEGQQALKEAAAVPKLCQIFSQQSFQTDQALNLLVNLATRFGADIWDENAKTFQSMINKIALDFESDQSERKFELATILFVLLSHCRKELVIPTASQEIWPGRIYKGLTDILTSKIGKNQRDPALKLVSVVLELCGVEWALQDEEKPKQFFFLLVQLCSIEVRMQLENRSVPQILSNIELITACFISLELSISFVALDTLDLEQKEKQSLYTALKGAFTAVLNTLDTVSKEYGKSKQLSSGERMFAVAMVRVLGAWLAQETAAMRNAVHAVFPFMLTIANETFVGFRDRGEGVDVLRFLLPALCHLTVEEKPRKIMLTMKQEEVFFEALTYHWGHVLIKKPKIPKAERLKMKNIPEPTYTPKQQEDMKDSRAAMISLCNIFMNLTVLEAKLVEDSPTFANLLKFIFSNVPELRNQPENLVLCGNLAVLGLLLLKQQVSHHLVANYQIPQNIATSITQSFLKSFRKCPEKPDLSLEEWRTSLWQQALGSEHGSLAGAIYRVWLDLRYEQLRPTSDVLSLLDCLKNSYFLALLTNGPSQSQWEKIHRLQLADSFHFIAVSGDLPEDWAKPNKGIFLMACDALGLAPNECLMVGDRLETDIEGAKKAGLAASVWIRTEMEKDLENRADFVVDCVEQLPCLMVWKKLNLSQYLDLSEPESENSNCSVDS